MTGSNGNQRRFVFGVEGAKNCDVDSIACFETSQKTVEFREVFRTNAGNFTNDVAGENLVLRIVESVVIDFCNNAGVRRFQLAVFELFLCKFSNFQSDL